MSEIAMHSPLLNFPKEPRRTENQEREIVSHLNLLAVTVFRSFEYTVQRLVVEPKSVHIQMTQNEFSAAGKYVNVYVVHLSANVETEGNDPDGCLLSTKFVNHPIGLLERVGSINCCANCS